MIIRLHNTLSGEKEVFKPIIPGRVGMYHCGPTVYDTPHIGNYRTFVMDDLLRRVFEYAGYTVDQVMNVTDVDDKTIRKSIETGMPLREVTAKYEQEFLSGLESLGILRPTHLLRATDNIAEMISLISKLINSGHAYPAKDGIYMSIEKVNDYGRLAHLDTAKAPGRERIQNDEYDKDDARDFALWKFETDADAGNSWPAPFGAGRPGWHIECSAMAMKALGQTIDIHTGGSDLIFPHHTNEIAQSESATGRKFANYWVHGGFMNIKSEKMSKSKRNVVRLEDFAEHGISPMSFRYWLLTAHYRSLIDFSFEAVAAAGKALERLHSTINSYPTGGQVSPLYREHFEKFISEDMDMPQALALSWELMKDSDVSPADKRATLIDFDRVFGLGIDQASEKAAEAIPEDIIELAQAREEARLAKDWSRADTLRADLENRGYGVRDGSAGPEVYRL